jgi:hypothetical protein
MSIFKGGSQIAPLSHRFYCLPSLFFLSHGRPLRRRRLPCQTGARRRRGRRLRQVPRRRQTGARLGRPLALRQIRIWSVSCRFSICDVPLLGEVLCSMCCSNMSPIYARRASTMKPRPWFTLRLGDFVRPDANTNAHKRD